ncbi:MAG: hypothetical protein IIX60_01370, partial [Clostridia bacterium]|nr:hypothetical protein [Clostridia bacterium]
KIRILGFRKKSKSKAGKTNIKSDVSNSEQKSGLELVNGSRKRRKRVRIITLSIVAAIILTVLIISWITPTGLIEYIQNEYAATGKGEFPVSVYSSNPEYFGCHDDIITLTNNTFFEVYNTNGKLLQAVSHGMSNPQLEVSEARFLLYDRERYSISIFNYSNELHTAEFENTIITADIGRNGSYAVVTSSELYKNSVYVYNKDNELKFTWNSANYYVTDVAVSDNGKKIAVCLLNSNAGSFESFVYILDFKSVTPKEKYSFNDIVSSVSNYGDYIFANGFDRAYSIKWDGGQTDLGVNGTIRCYDFDFDGNSCFVFGREDNEQINTIAVLNEDGKLTSTFQFNAAVEDIALTDEYIAVLSPTDCYLYNLKGELKSSISSEYKGVFVGLSSNGDVLVSDNSKLIKLK